MNAKPRAALLLLLTAAGTTSVRAQPADFATLDAQLGLTAQLAEPYGGRWTTGPGPVGRVATPFYGGRLHAGLRAYPNADAQADTLPDFLALHAEVGWGPALALPAGARLTGGAHLGAVAFRFDETEPYSGALTNELELAAGLFVRLDAPLGGPVRAWAGADGLHVFTAAPEQLLFVEGGLSVTVASPGWLRRFLR